MSDSHDHPHHDHALENPPSGRAPAPGPEAGDDAGAKALSEALRSSFAIVRVIMIGLSIVFLGSGFFTVGPQEKAIILRLGKPVGGPDGQLLNSGLHWAFPYPIDEPIRIPIGQVQAVTSSVGWYATTAAAEAAGAELPPGESLDPRRDGYLLTADQNVIHARATLRYRIAEPGLRFVLDFTSATNAVQNAFDSALVYAASRFQVDDALTRDVAGFREAIRARMNELIAQQGLGITVDQIENLRVLPPRWLKGAFDRVLEAGIRRSTVINEARSYENQTVSRAKAQADSRLNAGETERTRLVEFVAAEVERFTNNLPAYRANKDLFTQQRQSEMLRVVFTNAVEKTAVPERAADGKRTLIFQLSREPFVPKTVEPPKDEH